VKAVVETATAVSWTARGLMELKAEAYSAAFDDLRRAASMTNGNAASLAAALHGLSDAAAGAGRQDEERAWLQSIAAAQPGNVAVRVELARVLASSGDYEGAVAAAREAMRLAPDDPQPAEQLASVVADAGDGERLGALADEMLAHTRESARAGSAGQYYRATSLFLKGELPAAIEEARRFVAIHPNDARAQGLLGAACAAAGQHECAAAAFDAALAASPRDPTPYVNLGVFRLESGDPAAAAAYFAEALTLDPSSAAARAGLAQSRTALGKP
jgi:Flp pilus assembly protein TadD